MDAGGGYRKALKGDDGCTFWLRDIECQNDVPYPWTADSYSGTTYAENVDEQQSVKGFFWISKDCVTKVISRYDG